MTERRAHWDIDLVDGVGRRLIPLYRSIGYCTDAERHRIYALIEFVEDWQDRNQQARAMSITDNEAAIRRVRGIPEKESDVGYPNDWHIGWNACRESVLDALEERGRGQR